MVPRKWKERTDEFYAISDDGQKFRLVVYTEMLDNSEFSDSNQPVQGRKEVITAKEGYPCNPIDKDTFEIGQLGLRVKRI